MFEKITLRSKDIAIIENCSLRTAQQRIKTMLSILQLTNKRNFLFTFEYCKLNDIDLIEIQIFEKNVKSSKKVA